MYSSAIAIKHILGSSAYESFWLAESPILIRLLFGYFRIL